MASTDAMFLKWVLWALLERKWVRVQTAHIRGNRCRIGLLCQVPPHSCFRCQLVNCQPSLYISKCTACSASSSRKPKSGSARRSSLFRVFGVRMRHQIGHERFGVCGVRIPGVGCDERILRTTLLLLEGNKTNHHFRSETHCHHSCLLLRAFELNNQRLCPKILIGGGPSLTSSQDELSVLSAGGHITTTGACTPPGRKAEQKKKVHVDKL